MSATTRLVLVCVLSASASAQSGNLGVFTNSGDVGGPAIKGTAEFNPSNGQYRITGAGANMWAKQDQFQYVWREMSGNFTVTATMRFLGQGAEHRKAGIMVRQSLDTDATYADVVVHGNGMAGLQWRSRQGEDTNTFDLPIERPGTFKVKLVRTGVRIYMWIARDGARPQGNRTHRGFVSGPGSGRARRLLAQRCCIGHRRVLGCLGGGATAAGAARAVWRSRSPGQAWHRVRGYRSPIRRVRENGPCAGRGLGHRDPRASGVAGVRAGRTTSTSRRTSFSRRTAPNGCRNPQSVSQSCP